MLTPILIAAVVGYLLGSLPCGYLVARAKGVNIFEVGSKNPGATNVRRVLGTGPGNLVFALDFLKGAVATAWPLFHVQWTAENGALTSFNFSFGTGQLPDTRAAVAGLVGALLGHSFSVFTKFRGGKGVATATGGLLVLMPIAIVIDAVVWVVTFYTARYVSLASITAAVAIPFIAYFLHKPPILIVLAIVVGLLVILRHRANIRRLLAGTESKFGKKTEVPKP